MTAQSQADRPNIVLILADDMGFSDIGCYGSEIRTPNLDRLGRSGLRFTQMYNSARCCPSRAALLTGVNPQQAGVGHMVRDLGVPGYQGFLSEHCVTIAEALRAGGYRTLMSGKWHVGGDYDLSAPESWTPGDPEHPLPIQRGFERFFGTLTGAGTFFNPPTLMRGGSFVNVESPDFYYTDAITDNAVEMIQGGAGDSAPFFLYVAYSAPHWPLHAPPEDVARYEGTYAAGWDALRTSRHEQLKGMGLVDSRWAISTRSEDAPPWDDVEHSEWEALRMAVYAAQIDRLDQGVGRIASRLRELGQIDSTLIMFLSDNGGCAELFREDGGRAVASVWGTPAVDGTPVRVGNIPGLRPGGPDTFMSYDLPWANASNAPFRLFKHWVHEGGISTPFIVHWPNRIREGGIVHEPAHLIDVMATCLDAAGVAHPGERNGERALNLEGESLLPLMDGRRWTREQPIFWEHEGNRAVRFGQWKLVSEYPGAWELYDMDDDRTELNDLAGRNPRKAAELAGLYDEWAVRCGVYSWPVDPDVAARNTLGRHNHIVG